MQSTEYQTQRRTTFAKRSAWLSADYGYFAATTNALFVHLILAAVANHNRLFIAHPGYFGLVTYGRINQWYVSLERRGARAIGNDRSRTQPAA
jgi:hypothetical protein